MENYDVEALRKDFPILERTIGRRQLVYLDNTATSQTPQCVVERISEVYTHHKANVHRGVHTLSQEATMLQESARERIRRWINAESTDEIIFTRGTTESLNLVASSAGSMLLGKGDRLLLTVMEHHANIVPWQLLQPRLGFEIDVVGIRSDGSLDMDDFRRKLTDSTKIVAVSHISNVLGTVNPIKTIIDEAHAKGAVVVIDGAQAVAHQRVDVRALDADFYAFSAHKMYGPAGIGIVYGKRGLLEQMPPYQGGGEMIAEVTLPTGTTFAELPFKFEAGTPDFVDCSAFHQAIDYLETIGLERISAHEEDLLKYATERLVSEIPGIEIYGTTSHKCAIISFNVKGLHAYDIGVLLDKQGVAIRTGHHCAQPLMKALGIEVCCRASFALYNTRHEADVFVAALKRAVEMLS